MTKWIIFVTLKIIELLSVVFLPYLAGRTFGILRREGATNLNIWVDGLVTLILFISIILVGLISVKYIIYANLELANYLTNLIKLIKRTK